MDRRILTALIATSVLAIVSNAQAGPPTPSVNVSGSVSVDNFPATQNVQGSVQVSNLPSTQTVTGSVQVTNPPSTPLNVAIVPGDGGALSHFNQPIENHLQLETRSYTPTYPANLYVQKIRPDSGATSFSLSSGQCLVITEIEVDYIGAASSNGVVNFWLGPAASGVEVLALRQLFDVPDADGSGQISKTFPSGLVIKAAPNSYDGLGLYSPSAVAIYFGATGYLIECE